MRSDFLRITLNASILLAMSALGACASSSGGSAASEPEYEENAVIHQSSAADLEALKNTTPLTSREALLYVNGLGCPLCATNVDVQLKRLKGVESATVDLGAGTVLITMPSETRPSPHRLANAVEDAGFTLVKIETK